MRGTDWMDGNSVLYLPKVACQNDRCASWAPTRVEENVPPRARFKSRPRYNR